MAQPVWVLLSMTFIFNVFFSFVLFIWVIRKAINWFDVIDWQSYKWWCLRIDNRIKFYWFFFSLKILYFPYFIALTLYMKSLRREIYVNCIALLSHPISFKDVTLIKSSASTSQIHHKLNINTQTDCTQVKMLLDNSFIQIFHFTRKCIRGLNVAVARKKRRRYTGNVNARKWRIFLHL